MTDIFIHTDAPGVTGLLNPGDQPVISVLGESQAPQIYLQESLGPIQYPAQSAIGSLESGADLGALSGVLVLPIINGGRGTSLDGLTLGDLLTLLNVALDESEFTPAFNTRLNAFTSGIQTNINNIAAANASLASKATTTVTNGLRTELDATVIVANAASILSLTNKQNITALLSAAAQNGLNITANGDKITITEAGIVTLQNADTASGIRATAIEAVNVTQAAGIAAIEAAIALLATDQTTSASGYENIAIELAGYSTVISSQSAVTDLLRVDLDLLAVKRNVVFPQATAVDTLAVINEILSVTCSTANITITLPSASLTPGQPIYIRKVDATAWKVIVTGVKDIKYQGTTMHLISDGTNWVPA